MTATDRQVLSAMIICGWYAYDPVAFISQYLEFEPYSVRVRSCVDTLRVSSHSRCPSSQKACLDPPPSAFRTSALMNRWRRAFSLAWNIHERFCCNRGYAAATGGLAAQSVNVLQESTLPFLTAPRACLTTRLRDFTTNRHE